MNLNDIKERVRHIESISGDDESAHAAEDALYVAFIEHVAEHGEGELQEMAREALKVNALDFSRWYA